MDAIRLLALLLAVAALPGCGDHGITSNPLAAEPGSPFTFQHSADLDLDVAALGEVVFSDLNTWDAWKFVRRGQIWAQPELGVKWISFQPFLNRGLSPIFRGVEQFRVSFDLYLPQRFPVDGIGGGQSAAATTLVELSTRGPDEDGAPGEGRLAIDLLDGTTWRMRASGRGEDAERWDSADSFMMPSAFEHGWNRVEWTVVRFHVDGDPILRVKVQDRVYVWNAAILSRISKPFRRLAFGPWWAAIGDLHLAVSNVTVEDLARPLPSPPPSSLGGPCHDPDFPRVLGGSCVEMGGRTYNTRDAAKTGDEGNGVIAIKQHNSTATYIGGGRSGQVTFETWYDGAFEWHTGGGKHYHQITSFIADPRGDLDFISGESWLRCEIDELGHGRRPRVILWNYFPGWGQDERYNRGADRAYFDTLPPERTWVRWTFRWEQTDTSVKVWVTRGDTGETVVVESEIQPGSHPIGEYFWPTGHIEGTGQEWYRHRNITVN